MSVILAGTVAGLYAATVIGVQRWNVNRLRRQSGGFPTLRRLDWDTLFKDLLPSQPGPRDDAVPATLPGGTPTPESLRRPVDPGLAARRELLLKIVTGVATDQSFDEGATAGLSGSQLEWMKTLSLVQTRPLDALRALETTRPSSAAELYLREHLRLLHRTHAVNLEMSVFAAKRRAAIGLARFGDAPCLYFVRALASSMIGLNRATIDDMARAVYFSQQAPFYVNAVLEVPYVEEARPALTFQCRHSLDAGPGAAGRAGT